MKSAFNKYPTYIAIEFILAILASLILMVITYLLDGVDGIDKLVDGVGSQFQPTNLINVGILLLIGGFLWIFNYFFNHSAKFMLNKISHGLFDIGINILRLGGGILISFSILHLCVEGYIHELLSFWLVGFCAIAEAAFFSLGKDAIHQKRNRPLK